jgi:hypothetical protein
VELISILLLVGTTVAVPLGLPILQKRTLSLVEGKLIQLARKVQPIAAASLIGSFFFGPGHKAAALALPWLIFGIFIGAIALIRLMNGGCRFPIPLTYTAAYAYLPIGAAWLFASRAGINPMNFGEPIVLLTGVHFHFSGFAASIIAGEAARHLQDYPKAVRWMALGALLATPLIATGFVFSAPLKAIAILFFTTTLTTLAVLQAMFARRDGSGWPRRFLFISSLSILGGMFLASVYGITEYLNWPVLSIPQMVWFHGTLNAFGFTLCGLLGWYLQSNREAES